MSSDSCATVVDMHHIDVPGDRVRLPEAAEGTATVVRRYAKERAVVLHPNDFHRLSELDAFIAAAAALPALPLSDLAIRLHGEAETPSASVTDPVALRALLAG